MPTKEKHLEQYCHNKDFMQNGIKNTDRFLDWFVIGAFYSCVHLMEAYLARESEHPNDHWARYQLLNTRLNKDCMIAYNHLYANSKKARYDCITINNNDAIAAQDNLVVLEKFCKQSDVFK